MVFGVVERVYELFAVGDGDLKLLSAALEIGLREALDVFLRFGSGQEGTGEFQIEDESAAG